MRARQRVISEPWAIIFLISHICGWLVATLQTIWIVYEIRQKRTAKK